MVLVTESYAEYKSNLYTEGMGCVKNSDGSNFFTDSIPLVKVRERLETEEVEFWHDSATHPGTGETVIDESVSKIVRKRDHKVHGKRNSDGPQRQYTFLADLAAGVTGESPGDLKVTAVGTTRNGGRAYLQIATGNLLAVAGMEYEPFILFGMSHDQSLKITSATGTNVVACANMVAGLFGVNAVRKVGTRQTKYATDETVISKHAIVLGLEQQADEFDQAIRELSETTVTDKQIYALLDELAPLEVESKNQVTRNEKFRDEFNSMYRHDDRASDWEGTKLGLVQTLNTLDIWERNTRKGVNATVRAFDEFADGSRLKSETGMLKTVERVLASV
jgi:hypothetical protein